MRYVEKRHSVVKTTAFVVISMLLGVTISANIFLPFRSVVEEHEKNKNDTKDDDSCSHLKREYDEMVEGANDISFKGWFYGGLSFGALVGGLAGYHYGAANTVHIASKAFVTAGFLAYKFGEDFRDAPWFLFAATIMALYPVLYIDTIERVPYKWSTVTGLTGFGFCWPLGRAYSIFLATLVGPEKDVLFWNAMAALILACSRDLVAQHAIKFAPKKEKWSTFVTNPYAPRYFFSHLLLWSTFGFIYYGMSHWHISSGDQNHQLFVAGTDGVVKILSTGLVLWTRQKRTLIAVFIFLTGICKLVMIGTSLVEEGGWCEATSSVAHIISFLISGSWSTLWLASVEGFGPGVRY